MNNVLTPDSIIPISRFDKGEASKIFTEVKATGTKYVVQNNLLECVLLSPKMYDQMIENIVDMKLYVEALKRVNRPKRKMFTVEEAIEMFNKK